VRAEALMDFRGLQGATVLAALGFAGCAVSPLDGGTIENHHTAFGGFATEASAKVHVQAFDPKPQQWVTISAADVSASAEPEWGSTPKFDRALFRWNTAVDVPERYFEHGVVRLRSEQHVGANWTPMYSFDRIGFRCLTKRASDAYAAHTNLDVYDAGIECNRDTDGNERRELELFQPGALPDLVHGTFGTDGAGHEILAWLVPDTQPLQTIYLFAGAAAELPCATQRVNFGFEFRNESDVPAGRRVDRVAIPELGVSDSDELPRLSGWQLGDNVTGSVGNIFDPALPGRYGTLDVSASTANTSYSVEYALNYDRTLPESDFSNDVFQFQIVRRCQ